MGDEYLAIDPYKVLGVKKNAPFQEVRNAFKKKILQYHPDKGGDPAYFKILKDAYQNILNKHREKNRYRDRIEKEVKHQEYKPTLEDRDVGGLENVHVEQKNFNVNKFNQVFDQFKLKDPVMEKGYSENDFEPENLGDLDFKGRKVGQDEFNRKFNMHKKNVSTDVIIYKEPEAQWSLQSSSRFGQNYSNLGEEDIDDFSNKNSNIEFTDYKKAYSKDSKLINPDSIEVKNYKNVEHLKADRENISHEMSEEEKRYHLMKQQEEEEREQRRLGRLQTFDQRAEQNFNEINKRLIRN